MTRLTTSCSRNGRRRTARRTWMSCRCRELMKAICRRAGRNTARSATTTPNMTSRPNEEQVVFFDAAPRHLFNDTKHHRVSYTAVATSRYREYFPQDENLNFTRESEPVLVDVPASERPHAASVAYVLPTFGWQRQTDTNLKRSVRFGGG